jgi:hypothetical protein
MGRRPSASSLDSLPINILHAEIRRRQKSGSSLLKRREKLAAKLAALDAEIRAAGVAAGRGVTGRTRPQNAMSLAGTMAKVLNGKTMGVSELAEAVLKSGYNTHANNFRTMVNQTLIKNRKVFKKVDRGQYTTA